MRPSLPVLLFDAMMHHRVMRIFACLLFLCVAAASAQIPDLPAAERTVNSSSLPEVPKGQSSALGGKIAKLDPVRDQFTLSVPGGKNIKIFFDSRTQVFENGKKISVLDMRPAAHASVETRLDGTDIFAVRVHILTDVPQGNLTGQVDSFNAGTGKLDLHLAGTQSAITFVVPTGTPITRIGHPSFVKEGKGIADLVPGAMVDVTFKPGGEDRSAVTGIAVRAVPGAETVIQGELVNLDLHAGHLTIATAQDALPTNVAFDPSRFEVSRQLHLRDRVRVSARFDGTQYTATSIALE